MDDVLLHDGAIVGCDPLFVAPGLNAKPEGFRLQVKSPALKRGLASVSPLNDLSGTRRPKAGPINLGAFEK